MGVHPLFCIFSSAFEEKLAKFSSEGFDFEEKYRLGCGKVGVSEENFSMQQRVFDKEDFYAV